MPAHRKYANSAAKQAAYRSRYKARAHLPQTTPATGAVYRRWETMRKQALSLLNQVVCEMETYHDQRSQAWQDSLRGEAFNELMESMAETAEALTEISVHLPES